MKQQIILHLPHSSIRIPIREGFIVSKKELEEEILKLTDWHTEDLFHSDDDDMIIADFSRIFCDTERFADDSQEIMAKFGMGVLYEKSDDGEVIRTISPALRERILQAYYWRHHQKLSQSVNQQLKSFDKALIIDCHSFPSKPLIRDLEKKLNRPDFNIGTDSFHTPQKLIDISVAFFEKAGYTLGIDYPYKGSIVPSEHYKKNKNVHSIMLEINRALYLKEPTNEKTANYLAIKKLTREYIQTIKNSL
jgi:N-formylglutamate amidohydrolase